MTSKRFLSGTTKTVMATVAAAGLVAAPVAFSSGFDLTTNTALAYTGDFAPGTGDSVKTPVTNKTSPAIHPDAAFAGDFPSGMGDSEKGSSADYTSPLAIVGVTNNAASPSTPQEVRAAGIMLRDYKRDLVMGDLIGASAKLAALSKKPITQQLVDQLNTQLGAKTRLLPQQIAAAAALRQKV